MPRKGPVPPRVIPPDVVYGNVMVQRLINKVMTRGKKTLAERIVYGALRLVEQRSGQDPVRVLEKALQNVMPVLEVKPRRVGGANYQVPVEVRPEPVAGGVRPPAPRAGHGGEAGPGDPGRQPGTGRRGEAEGRGAPDGGGQQGLRPLPVVAPGEVEGWL